MRLTRTDRRRVIGAVFLSLAVLMLVAGQTDFHEGLNIGVRLVYWLLCFLFTIAAMCIALWDLRVLRRNTREEQRDLVQGMVKDVSGDAGTKPHQPAANDPHPRR